MQYNGTVFEWLLSFEWRSAHLIAALYSYERAGEGRQFLWASLVFEVPDAFLWRSPSYAIVILVSCATVLQAFAVCQSMLRLWKQFCKRTQEERSTESLIYMQRTNGPNVGPTRAPTSASLDVTHKPNVNASYCSLSHCCLQVVLNFHLFSMYTQPRKFWLWRHERHRVVTMET